MEKLNLPDYTFRLSKNEEGEVYIFDELRKKKLLLTPEEWVRQHILRYLIEEKGYPGSLISAEAGLKVNQLSRRYDALIYNRKGEAVLLIECKAPSVTVKQEVFDQILAYNREIKASHLLVSNGLKHFCCRIDPDSKQYVFLKEIPDFEFLDRE